MQARVGVLQLAQAAVQVADVGRDGAGRVRGGQRPRRLLRELDRAPATRRRVHFDCRIGGQPRGDVATMVTSLSVCRSGHGELLYRTSPTSGRTGSYRIEATSGIELDRWLEVNGFRPDPRPRCRCYGGCPSGAELESCSHGTKSD
jgi:hypothetical protein